MAWAQQSLAINEFKCVPDYSRTSSSEWPIRAGRIAGSSQADTARRLTRSDPRWSKYTDPVTGRTVGAQLMLNQSFKTSMGYKWGGLAVVIFAAFFFNGLIWLALAALKGVYVTIVG